MDALKHTEYLGDGLVAEIEHGMVKLWTERENGTHVIYMEPEVLDAFERWVRSWTHE